MRKKSDFTIIPRKKNSGRPTKRPSIEQLRLDYSEMTTREMAAKYEVSEATVRSWVFRARRGCFEE